MDLKTERLRIRNFRIEDLDMLYEINNHPECIRFNSWNEMSRNECTKVLEKWIAESQVSQNYGVFCVEDLEEQAIGMTFIMKYEKSNDYEIGFRLKRDEWSKGYATELTNHWIEYCKDILVADSVRAEVSGENYKSLSIFRNNGFQEFPHPSGGDGSLFIKEI